MGLFKSFPPGGDSGTILKQPCQSYDMGCSGKSSRGATAVLLADCRCTVILHSRAAGMDSFCMLVMAPIVQEHNDGLLPVPPLSLSDHVAALVLRFLLKLQLPLPGWISF